MSAPPEAVAALVWAVVGPPIIVYGATRVRGGRLALHRAVMLASVAVELAALIGFLVVIDPGPRRADLTALPLYTIHLAFAFTTLAGIAWQLASRAAPRLRPLHRHTGPYVALAWCLALLTGIYNFVFVYVMGAP
jgi:uncharacterized membrane protein YozB (DUF420 family)